jgi:hypothetical protein
MDSSQHAHTHERTMNDTVNDIKRNSRFLSSIAQKLLPHQYHSSSCKRNQRPQLIANQSAPIRNNSSMPSSSTYYFFFVPHICL